MKTRLWCGTNYDMTLDYAAVYSENDIKFLAYGEERCPSTGREHHQFFVLFQNPRSSIKNVATIFGGAHVEPCKGSITHNEKYCSKESQLITFGEKPKQGDRVDIAALMQMVRDGSSELEIAEAAPTLWCQYGKRLEAYRALKQPTRCWKPEIKVFWGPPGSGKTRAAVEWLGEYDDVTYTQGGFFIGYHNHENVLLDDFDYKTMPRDMFLKVADRYQLTVNIKNGECNFNPRRIAITSNYDPSEWYNWGDPTAITRRISEIIYLDNSGTEVVSG